jgi:hypothetical protein
LELKPGTSGEEYRQRLAGSKPVPPAPRLPLVRVSETGQIVDIDVQLDVSQADGSGTTPVDSRQGGVEVRDPSVLLDQGASHRSTGQGSRDHSAGWMEECCREYPRCEAGNLHSHADRGGDKPKPAHSEVDAECKGQMEVDNNSDSVADGPKEELPKVSYPQEVMA